MAKIDRLVNVAIDLNTTTIAGKSFSDLLILGEHTLNNSARLLVVTDPNELLDLGLKSNNPLYIAVATAFAQPSHVAQVFIGRKAQDESVTDALAAVARENNSWYGLALVSREDADVMLAVNYLLPPLLMKNCHNRRRKPILRANLKRNNITVRR